MKTAKERGKMAGMILAVLLLLVVTAIAVLFWYYPRYRSRQTAVSVEDPQTEEITVMSCNVRCLTPLDLGKRSWFYRADLLVSDIDREDPGIIGFQEVTKWQYRYLVDAMAQYDSVITYRDDSVMAEGCPIFYDTRLFTLIDKGSFWLSETPEVMSKDWGAACYRICSYVILTEKASGKEFVVFNTHLDHVSDEARIKGIEVVLDKIAQFGGLPAVIMGDLNAEAGSRTYSSVTEYFLDAAMVADTAEGDATYQGWGESSGRRIDYFVISPAGFHVREYRVTDIVHEGIYASDHSPIVMKVILE